ncbi:MAG: hypothetical protein K2O40_01985 [Lachnospiraceae bacterium]|nr:hypothetical protein [Lachnospiraceae bacterium]
MNPQQKTAIIPILKTVEATRSYQTNYWFAYQDYLDPTDDFTDFVCERLEGKQAYLDLIQELLTADQTAKIFVQVYGYEEYENAFVICSDTLIILSRLSFSEIEHIFNAPKDIFPSDIGIEQPFFAQQSFVVGENGDLLPAENFCAKGHSAYYCWWD